MSFLRLDRPSPDESALRERVIAIARSEAAQGVAEIAQSHRLAEDRPDADEVAAEAAVGLVDSPASADPEAQLYSSLRILCEREQQLFRYRFEHHSVSRRVLAELVTQTGRLQDSIKTHGLSGYVDAAAKALELPRELRLALALYRRFGLETPLARQLAKRLELLLTLRSVVEDLEQFAKLKLLPVFGDVAAHQIAIALERRVADTSRAIDGIELQYPNYAKTLRRNLLALAALRIEEDSLARLNEESILPDQAFTEAMRDLNLRRKIQERRPTPDLGFDPRDLVTRVDLFRDAAPSTIGELTNLMRPRLAAPGETIVRKGEYGDGMYFISSGAVEVSLAAGPLRLGSGQFFGEMSLLYDHPRNADVVAIGFCQLLYLPRSDFQIFMDRNPAIRDQIHVIAEGRRVGA
jgi:CPA1 family monovalent cation:H+ antiporter